MGIGRPKTVKVGGVDFDIDPTAVEANAAWEIFVELSTRVTTYPLEDGLIREALNSIHLLVSECRGILRKHGPEVGKLPASVGQLTIGFLNGYIRPFLSKWHPLLAEWELAKGTSSALAHERSWAEREQCLAALADMRTDLDNYRVVFATIADIAI